MRSLGIKVTTLLGLIILLGIVVVSLGAPQFSIHNVGRIRSETNVTRPLHTEGRYIKDDLGNIVNLRGVFKAEFTDTCSGWFSRIGYSYSDDGYGLWGGDGNGLGVHQMCQVLRDEWGANFVGIYITADWWIRNAQETISEYVTSTDITYREAIKGFIEIAGQYGIYVMISIYEVKKGEYCRIPYPESQNVYAHDGSIFADKTDFIDWYVNSLAYELKDYPNIIFCPYDEPVTWDFPNERYYNWHDTVQQIIDGVRALPSSNYISGLCENLFLYHYGWCGGLNFVWDIPLTGNNIVYSGTVYRYHYTFPNFEYEYDDVKAVLESYGYRYVVEDLSLPLMNYIGAFYGQTDEYEYLALVNTLRCWNEWEQGYAVYQWHRSDLAWAIQLDASAIQPPNRIGQALIDAIITG